MWDYLATEFVKFLSMLYDSLIFDLDGTLWDATETYAKAWCNGLAKINSDAIVTADRLKGIMGIERAKSLEMLLPDLSPEVREKLYDDITPEIRSLASTIGGELYDGVLEGIKLLSTKYKVFIVSNCAKGLIQDFITWSGLGPYIIDEIAHGASPKPKCENIRLMIEKHELKNSIYIGDTPSDGIQSRKARVPFVYVSYGFSETDDYDLKFDSFDDLVTHFIDMKA